MKEILNAQRSRDRIQPARSGLAAPWVLVLLMGSLSLVLLVSRAEFGDPTNLLAVGLSGATLVYAVRQFSRTTRITAAARRDEMQAVHENRARYVVAWSNSAGETDDGVRLVAISIRNLGPAPVRDVQVSLSAGFVSEGAHFRELLDSSETWTFEVRFAGGGSAAAALHGLDYSIDFTDCVTHLRWRRTRFGVLLRIPGTTAQSYRAPRLELRRSIGIGMSGADVRYLQQRLTEAGIDQLDPDGRFGPQTDSAVRALQVATGLEPNGLVDYETWRALERSARNPARRRSVSLTLDQWHQLREIRLGHTSRGMREIADSIEDGMPPAASRLLDRRSGEILIVTGFPIVIDGQALQETDGPVGAAFLASVLASMGKRVAIVSEQFGGRCVREAIRAIEQASGVSVTGSVRTVEVNLNESAALRRNPEQWCRGRSLYPGTVVFIERTGPAINHHYHSMDGEVLDGHVAALDRLTQLPRVVTIGIGDGGNEVGMGNVPESEIGQYITNGPQIHCEVTTSHLVLSGVSNWGAAVLALVVGATDGREEVLRLLKFDNYEAAMNGAVQGGAVDGITRRAEPSEDGHPLSEIKVGYELALRILGVST